MQAQQPLLAWTLWTHLSMGLVICTGQTEACTFNSLILLPAQAMLIAAWHSVVLRQAIFMLQRC